jgi:hypothetical protein
LTEKDVGKFGSETIGEAVFEGEPDILKQREKGITNNSNQGKINRSE